MGKLEKFDINRTFLWVWTIYLDENLSYSFLSLSLLSKRCLQGCFINRSIRARVTRAATVDRAPTKTLSCIENPAPMSSNGTNVVSFRELAGMVSIFRPQSNFLYYDNDYRIWKNKTNKLKYYKKVLKQIFDIK